MTTYAQLSLQGGAENNDIMVQDITGLRKSPQVVATQRALAQVLDSKLREGLEFEPLEIVLANYKAKIYWYRPNLNEEFDVEKMDQLDTYEPVENLRPITLQAVENLAWVNCRVHIRKSAIYLSVQIANLLYESGFIEL